MEYACSSRSMPFKLIRFMAWERSFEKRVDEIRNRELHWQVSQTLTRLSRLETTRSRYASTSCGPLRLSSSRSLLFWYVYIVRANSALYTRRWPHSNTCDRLHVRCCLWRIAICAQCPARNLHQRSAGVCILSSY